MQFIKTDLKRLDEIIFNPSLFRIAYIIDLFLGMLAFLEPTSLVLKCLILSWGALIFIHNFIKTKAFLKIKYYKILILFLGLCLFTTLLHFNDNLLANLLFIYHTSICFFMFYGMNVQNDKKSIEKEMVFIFKFITISTTLLSCLGLLIFAFKTQINIQDYWLGIYQNRFIGVYSNPNLLAFSCVLSIIFGYMLTQKDTLGQYTKNKHLYIASIVINIGALILSDSNASLLFFILYIIVLIFYKLFSNKTFFSISDIIKRSTLLVLCCLVLFLLTFGLRNFVQDKVAIFVNDIHQSQEPIHDNKNEFENIITEEEVTDDDSNDNEEESIEEAVEIGRDPLSGSYDVSSGRITLLKQSLIMFKNHPFFGVGRGNIVEYGLREIPGGLRFSDFHNGYVTILVSWGTIGFIIFSSFALMLAIDMCKSLFNMGKNRDSKIYSNLFSIIVSYAFYSLFEKTILSEITFMVVIFWLILGYASTYINVRNNFAKEGLNYEGKLLNRQKYTFRRRGFIIKYKI